MARSRGTSRRSGFIPLSIVVVLAVVALLLVIYALRTPQVADEGELPGPAPTWNQERAPSATPTPTPTAAETADSVPQRLSAFDSTSVVRSTRGVCAEGIAPVLEVSQDGGRTWTPQTFGSNAVREVLALDYVNESQIDAIAKIGSSCSISMVTSFTNGEFWASYPDRTAEAIYFDPASPGTISVDGVPVPSPCTDLVQVVGLANGAAALCKDGIQVYDFDSAIWSGLSGVSAYAIAATSGGAQVVAAVDGAPSCDGVRIERFDALEPQPNGQNLACITRDVAQPDTTLALVGNSAFLWSASSLLTSADQGATWAQPR